MIKISQIAGGIRRHSFNRNTSNAPTRLTHEPQGHHERSGPLHGRAFRFALTAVVAGILALLGTASPAVAGTSTQIVPEDVTGMVFLNPCTGENIIITSGTLQLLVTTSDTTGGLHLVVHGNAQGVTATGESTGDMYRLAGDFWIEENVAANGFPLVVQVVETHNVISAGSAPNFLVHLVSHLTINANGTVTAAMSSDTAECLG
jgi:hypothetical protein